MSQSELRNFEKSMAYHLAPAMLGIKPACLMSMERTRTGLKRMSSFLTAGHIQRA